jgi:tRNA(fMet)-specific endonuclease VapC
MGDTFAICIPVITESLFGLSILPRGMQNRAEWVRLRAHFQLISPDERDAEAAADRQIVLRQRGRQLATVDALIAAIALRYGLLLLTTDTDFQAIPGLAQENWMQR